MNHKQDIEFEEILRCCFKEELKNEIMSLPTEEELSKTHKFSTKFMRRTNKLIKHQYRKNTFNWYVRKAAVIFIIIIGLGAALLMASPGIRAEMQNILIKWFNVCVEFVLKKDVKSYSFYDITFTLNYIPKEYELTDSSDSHIVKKINYKSKNNKNEMLSINIFPDNSNVYITVDNEKRTVTRIKNNNLNGYLFDSKKDREFNVIVIYYENIIIKITGTVSADELIKIVENIKIK